MSDESIDRVTPTKRPARFAIGHQRWNDLLFLHWDIPLSQLRPLVPDELEIDTFEGRAYVSIVPFEFSRVRLAFTPPLPRFSTFPEVNVRTYVHRDGADPGVWFFSLDASRTIAVALARALFNLPYYKARVRLTRMHGAGIDFVSRRADGAQCHLVYEPTGGIRQAAAGSLEFFLLERYILYGSKDGQLYRGRIHHQPYPVRDVIVRTVDESLLAAAGMLRPHKPPLAHYARAVDVEFFRFENAG